MIMSVIFHFTNNIANLIFSDANNYEKCCVLSIDQFVVLILHKWTLRKKKYKED